MSNGQQTKKQKRLTKKQNKKAASVLATVVKNSKDKRHLGNYHPPTGICPPQFLKYIRKKGDPGLPGAGAPKRKPLMEAYRGLLQEIDPDTGCTYAQLIAIGQVDKAVQRGDTFATKEIREGSGEGNQGHVGTLDPAMEQLAAATAEELDTIIDEYLKRRKDARKNSH